MTDLLDTLGKTAADIGLGALKGAAAGSVVPGFGTALGAAGGAVIAAVPQLSRWVFGSDAQPTIDAVKQVVTAATGTTDPDAQAAAMKDEAVMGPLRVQLAGIAAAREQEAHQAQLGLVMAASADRQKAREASDALAARGSPLAYGAAVVTALVMTIFVLMFWRLLGGQMPDDPDLKTVAIAMIVTVQTAFATSVGYWVGSSAGSAAKDRRAARS